MIASSAWDGSRLYVAGYLAKINKQSCESTIRAIDPSTGRFVWSDCLSGGKALGAVTAVPGVVFEGLGSILYGVSSARGKVLFRFEEPNLVVIDVTPSSDVSEIGGCWAAQLSFSALLTYLWVG